MFLTTVPSRDKNTLLPILKHKIKPGTTIISDCWKSYDCLSEEDFEHLTVNHSVNFVDSQTGCHTQNIENLCDGKLKDNYQILTLDTTKCTFILLNICGDIWREKRKIFSKNFSKMHQNIIMAQNVIFSIFTYVYFIWKFNILTQNISYILYL